MYLVKPATAIYLKKDVLERYFPARPFHIKIHFSISYMFPSIYQIEKIFGILRCQLESKAAAFLIKLIVPSNRFFPYLGKLHEKDITGRC